MMLKLYPAANLIFLDVGSLIYLIWLCTRYYRKMAVMFLLLVAIAYEIVQQRLYHLQLRSLQLSIEDIRAN